MVESSGCMCQVGGCTCRGQDRPQEGKTPPGGRRVQRVPSRAMALQGAAAGPPLAVSADHHERCHSFAPQ